MICVFVCMRVLLIIIVIYIHTRMHIYNSHTRVHIYIYIYIYGHFYWWICDESNILINCYYLFAKCPKESCFYFLVHE